MSILSSVSNFDTHSVAAWDNYRKNYFPIVDKWIYYDHAAVSPLSKPARTAIDKWLGQATEEGDTAWPQWASRIEEIRANAARLVNSEKSEIAFVPSTSFGISLVAEGLDWQPGDNIVIPAGEFPSNLYPWMNLKSRGVELRIVPTDSAGRFTVEQIENACDENTRLISTSWVGYATGFRIDPKSVSEVARRHNALYFLDAIQGLGVFPLDVQSMQVDFFAADGHKWLMGPEGAGLFYCRHSLLEKINPRVIGWNSVQSAHDFSKVDLTFRDSAARFEAGTQNVSGILGLGASIDLIQSCGVNHLESPIATRILELTDGLVSGLQSVGWSCCSSREPHQKSGIVSFEHADADPVVARKVLLENKIVTSVRKNWLRFSPHAYNNQEDIDKTVRVLAEMNS